MGGSHSSEYQERLKTINPFVLDNKFRPMERINFIYHIRPNEELIFGNGGPSVVKSVKVINSDKIIIDFEKINSSKDFFRDRCLFGREKNYKITKNQNSLTFEKTEEECKNFLDIDNFEMIGINFFEDLERQQNQELAEWNESGILKDKLPEDLLQNLEQKIETYASKTRKDYHPGTKNRVRDLVHPSLFPYIKGETETLNLDQLQEETIQKDSSNIFMLDSWGRKHEKSKYQWLPSEFKINDKGECKIESYINGMETEELYPEIEKTFEYLLPDFEKIVSLGKQLKPRGEIDPDTGEINKLGYLFFGANLKRGELGKCDEPEFTQLEKISLKGRTLQVITKIVTVEMEKNDLLSGAWHAEGMSHEHIFATAVCVIDQKNIRSDLFFKREMTECEGEYLYELQGQDDYFQYFSDFIDNEQIPMGNFKSKTGSVVVFPNSHIHKLDLETGNKKGKRTILVFWLIDPDVRVISTKNVERDRFSYQEGKKHRLKLMEDRTYYKQSFNARKINLCEH